jgi:hypothetical protein
MRTFLPFDTNDLTVIALDDNRVALQSGRNVAHYSPEEAVNLGDSLIKAGIVASPILLRSEIYEQGLQHGRGHQRAPGALPALPALPPPAASVIDDAMVKRAVDAWEQWWNDYKGTLGGSEIVAASLKHVLQQALEVKA